MEKLRQNQLPDSSSSPPLSEIFQTFDDDVMSELPSCAYAQHHIQYPSSNFQFNSTTSSNLKLSIDNFKQQNYPEYGSELALNPRNLTLNNPRNFNAQSKNSQSKSGPIRERKRILRSAPNGYLISLFFVFQKVIKS